LLGLSGVIAAIYAGADGSRERKFKTSHFTAGSRDGRCQECEGTGLNRVSLDFFADAVMPCERCGGTGFRDEVLEVTIDGTTIYDALQISFTDLSRFVEAHQRNQPDQKTNILLNLIEKTGLGHLTGGRSLKTLSTGELQRLKLVSGFASKTGSSMLILLDEPTGGLDPRDIERLLKLFDELTGSGNTIVCVTHEPLLINSASRVIELGPGGGRNGGRIVTSDAGMC
jgi:excinuclease ABC subunit A